jgi:hypothetical protein
MCDLIKISVRTDKGFKEVHASQMHSRFLSFCLMFCSKLNQHLDKKLPELTLYLAKTHFCLFRASNKENKFGGKYHGSF